MLVSRPSEPTSAGQGPAAPVVASSSRWIAAFGLPSDLLAQIKLASLRMRTAVRVVSLDWLLHPIADASPAAAAADGVQGTCRLALLSASAINEATLAALAELRRRAITIIVIGPRFGTEGHRRALAAGADEVWSHGLDTELIGALLLASLRRCEPQAASPATLDLKIETGHRTCVVSGRRLWLSRAQSALLDALATAFPDSMRREDLYRCIGIPSAAQAMESRSLDMQMSKIRKLFREHGVVSVDIEAVRGSGYRLRTLACARASNC